MALPQQNITEARYLIVDSMPEARATISNALTSIGVTRLEQASRSEEALQRIRAGTVDVILCDLNLQHRFDGLYLLEALRQQQLMKPSAIFMMVTAEASSRFVVSAAEMAPDEYVLKPFSAEMLRQRIERAFYKKQHFKSIDDAIWRKDYNKALTLCDARIRDNDLFATEFIRLKARLYLQTGDARLAGETYRMMLAKKDVPWARIGLGKAFLKLQKFELAQRLFEEVVARFPYAMEAYDGLASCLVARNDTLGAQALLQKAVNLSPATIARLRQFGSVAKSNEDWERVAFAYASSIDLGQHSFHHDPLDYAQLSHAQLEQGDYQAAQQSMSRMEKVFDTTQAKVLAKVVHSRLAFSKGDIALANQMLDEALSQHESGKADISETVSIELAGACYASQRLPAAARLMEEVLLNHADRHEVLQHVELMYRSVGQEDHGKELIIKHRSALEEMNRFATFMREKGDLEGAVLHFLAAAGDRPRNVTILLNAINALLAFVEANGWHQNYLSIAKEYLERLGNMVPSNSRYQYFQTQYRRLLTLKPANDAQPQPSASTLSIRA